MHTNSNYPLQQAQISLTRNKRPGTISPDSQPLGGGRLEVSRRSFLQLSVSSLFIVSTGCGGGGGGNETIPDPGRFKAQVDGSVFDNTGRLFGITSIVVPEFNDEKVVAIHYRHQTLLSSDRLVFEVNGERKDGGADSAKRTQVQQGDVIGWKMI